MSRLTLYRLVAAVFIFAGVVLIVTAGTDGWGSPPRLVGIGAVVVGVLIRFIAPTDGSPWGNANVITPGRVPTGLGGPTPMAGPSRFQGRDIAGTFSAADVVAHGVASTGQLDSVAMTGKTAGQVAPNLPPHEADDPIVHIGFRYEGPSGVTLISEAMIRVPDGKLEKLSPGAIVPVRYLPDRPEVAAIDWSRL